MTTTPQAIAAENDIVALTHGMVLATTGELATVIDRHIAPLVAENERYRKALEEIASGARYSMYDTADCFNGLGECRGIARAALHPEGASHE